MARVLVVDDDPAILEYSRVFLENAGHDMVGLSGAGKALTAEVARGDAALILLDWHLPGVQGAELAQQLKAQAPEAKVLIYSGAEETQLQHMASEAGVDGYLRKGVDPGTFLATVARYV